MRVNLLWNAILPALTFFKGYTPMSMLGMGEDLPYGVYKQWRQWCKYPHYFFDDPSVSEEMQEKFAQIKVPIVAANAVDDLWALPKSRDAFMHARLYKRRCDLARHSLNRITAQDWAYGLF